MAGEAEAEADEDELVEAEAVVAAAMTVQDVLKRLSWTSSEPMVMTVVTTTVARTWPTLRPVLPLLLQEVFV